MLDAIDGCGKDTLIELLIKEFPQQKVFNLNHYWASNGDHPEEEEWQDTDIIFSSEPSYAPIGSYVRNELIRKGSSYSTQTIAQGYALDRNILYEKVLMPALQAGKTVIQSRGVSTTIVYQQLTGNDDNFTLNDILSLPGNKFALENAPDYLLIPYVDDVKEMIKNRLENREKQDNAIFEKASFLEKAQAIFRSPEFTKIFTKHGTEVIYMNNSGTLEEAKIKIHEIYKNYLEKDICS